MFSEYYWEQPPYSGKITTLTHNDLNKYLHHYFIEDLKKTNNERVKYKQHHFSESNSIDPAPITRKDSESSDNTSSDEENGSESEEGIVLTTIPFV